MLGKNLDQNQAKRKKRENYLTRLLKKKDIILTKITQLSMQ